MRRALLVLGAVVVLLAIAQLVMPGIAARKLAGDLRKNATAVHVDVAAFPAIKLLWHRADRVTVTAGDYRPGRPRSGASLADELASTKATDRLDVRVRVLADRLLRIHDVTVRKRGNALVAQVRIRRPELNAALPPQLHLTGRSTAGAGISVAGVTSAFGRRLAARARILVDSKGRIVLRPEGFPLAALVSVPLFSDDRVAVDAINARPAQDGFVVTARGHLR